MFQTAVLSGNSFALSVCPTSRGQFRVVISPVIPNLASQVEVSTRKFRSFLMRHPRKVAVAEGMGTSQLLVSPVSEAEVRELTEGATEIPADR